MIIQVKQKMHGNLNSPMKLKKLEPPKDFLSIPEYSIVNEVTEKREYLHISFILYAKISRGGDEATPGNET